MASVAAAWCALAGGCSGPGGGSAERVGGEVEAGPAAASARALFREAAGVVSRHALGGERVDWVLVERELVPGVAERGPPAGAYPAIVALLERLGDPHVALIPAPSGPGTGASGESGPTGGGGDPPRPAIPEAPVGRMLEGGVGYLLMPGCSAADVDGLRRYATAARGEISRLDGAGARGWVIDLRLNGGGNLWPMLLGLAPLLGEGPAMATVAGAAGDGGEVVSRYGVSRGQGAWIDWGHGPETQLAMADGVSEGEWVGAGVGGPVAVVLGPWTMSSGEALAVSLVSRRGARTFGEPTAGLTTVTNWYPLSDGSVLVLPVSRMAGLDGAAVSGRLMPGVPAAFEGWPGESDPASEAARRWVVEKIVDGHGGAGGGGGDEG
ncbi:MAG: hypothetical protein HRU70_01940 [Phycisphaeraceae bacterium]|nr:MAG: hypothetical protein HRU70_01940 [Phycisphaeraceae bacterium]